MVISRSSLKLQRIVLCTGQQSQVCMFFFFLVSKKQNGTELGKVCWKGASTRFPNMHPFRSVRNPFSLIFFVFLVVEILCIGRSRFFSDKFSPSKLRGALPGDFGCNRIRQGCHVMPILFTLCLTTNFALYCVCVSTSMTSRCLESKEPNTVVMTYNVNMQENKSAS